MKSIYLSLYKSEKQRVAAPAVQRSRAHKKKRDEDSFPLRRILKFGLGPFLMALRAIRTASLIDSRYKQGLSLPFDGHKYQEVVATLESVAFEVWSIDSDLTVSKTGKIPWFFSAVLPSMPILSRCLRSSKLRAYSEVVFLYEILRRQFAESELRTAWVIVGDLTMPLIALSAAAKHSGHMVVYWQYSLLDFKRMPVESDYAVILNERGPELGRVTDPERIFWHAQSDIKPLKLHGVSQGPIGAFLNVHANQDSIALLARIADHLDQPIHVRLHPNSQLTAGEWPEQLKHAPSSEPLEEFSERISLAICGNTQAQIKTLTNGTPVVQFGGLDILEFDHHEYIQKGIIPGFERLQEFSFESLNEFYQDPNSRIALKKFLEVPSERAYKPLHEFNDVVSALKKKDYAQV